MLRAVYHDEDGRETEVPNILKIELDSDMEIPADSVTLVCAYDPGFEGNRGVIRLFDGETPVFCGRPDSIVRLRDGSGDLLRVTARSLAAALLDNEAEPLVYSEPSAQLIANKHLLPFGITPTETDSKPYYGAMRIDKGMTHWQAIRRFCKCRYGSEPWIDAQGRAYLRGIPRRSRVVFSNGGGGLPFLSVKEKRELYKLISEVRVKFSQTNTYRSVIKNGDPEAAHADRVRYVNAAADNTTLETADRMIANSSRDSYSITLGCAYCASMLVGREAVLTDGDFGVRDGLIITKVRYAADSGGETGEITLKRSRFYVADELHNE